MSSALSSVRASYARMINSLPACRGAPGGGAAGVGGDAGSAEAIFADAVEENLRDG